MMSKRRDNWPSQLMGIPMKVLPEQMDTKSFGYSWEEIEGCWLWMEVCPRCYRGPLSGPEVDKEDGNLCIVCEATLNHFIIGNDDDW
jgi:hypothetical protein